MKLTRLSRRIAALALIVSSFLFLICSPLSVLAANEKATIGMPFQGKWAYNANVNPPYTDSNSSHPTVHPIYGSGYNWSTDLYAAAGTSVKWNVSGSTGTLTYSWASSSTGCGSSTAVNVSDNGVAVGTLYVAHLSGAVTSGTITNGMSLGTVANLSCNPGPHVHVEFKSSINPACYKDHGNPGVTLGEGIELGTVGTTGSTANRQACAGGSTIDLSTHSKTASITRSSTSMDIFYRDTNNNLLNMGWDASTGWGSPVGRGLTCGVGGNPCVAGNPVAVARSSVDMDVFYRDSNGNLQNTGWNSGTGWGSTVSRASGIVGNPTVISRSSTSMDVFYRDSSGNLKNVGWDSTTGWGSAVTRVTCGGSTPCVTTDPIAITRYGNSMDVFFRDDAGNLQNIGWDASIGWGSVNYRGGNVSGSPSAITRNWNDMDVFYRDTNNNLLNVGWNGSTGWTSPTGRGLTCGVGGNPCVNGDPIAIKRDANNMDVFYPDSANNLENTGWNNVSGWSATASRANNAVGGNPSAISRSSVDMDIFFRSMTGTLNNAGWNSSVGWELSSPGGSNIY